MRKDFSFLPLSENNWNDLVELFGDKGACGGCWCMNWRLHASEYNRMKGDGNKKAMKDLVKRSSPGMIAYAKEKPVGWCAIAPRAEYIRLERSKILRPVDDKDVWSVSCFFIHKQYRRKGLSLLLLCAAMEFAFSKGAMIIEGYPVEATEPGKRVPDVFTWTGLTTLFLKAGFEEVARRSAARPVMRYFKN